MQDACLHEFHADDLLIDLTQAAVHESFYNVFNRCKHHGLDITSLRLECPLSLPGYIPPSYQVRTRVLHVFLSTSHACFYDLHTAIAPRVSIIAVQRSV
jgi:hypothetical protein